MKEGDGRTGRSERSFHPYPPQLLVAGSELAPVRGTRSLPLEDLVPILDPPLGCGLAKVDLLRLVPAGVGI